MTFEDGGRENEINRVATWARAREITEINAGAAFTSLVRLLQKNAIALAVFKESVVLPALAFPLEPPSSCHTVPYARSVLHLIPLFQPESWLVRLSPKIPPESLYPLIYLNGSTSQIYSPLSNMTNAYRFTAAR